MEVPSRIHPEKAPMVSSSKKINRPYGKAVVFFLTDNHAAVASATFLGGDEVASVRIVTRRSVVVSKDPKFIAS